MPGLSRATDAEPASGRSAIFNTSPLSSFAAAAIVA
jgi:hypothetical protein